MQKKNFNVHKNYKQKLFVIREIKESYMWKSTRCETKMFTIYNELLDRRYLCCLENNIL